MEGFDDDNMIRAGNLMADQIVSNKLSILTICLYLMTAAQCGVQDFI
jgi:hypothetical protein